MQGLYGLMRGEKDRPKHMVIIAGPSVVKRIKMAVDIGLKTD